MIGKVSLVFILGIFDILLLSSMPPNLPIQKYKMFKYVAKTFITIVNVDEDIGRKAAFYP